MTQRWQGNRRRSEDEALEYAKFVVKRCHRLVKVKDQEEPDKEIFVSFYGYNKGCWTSEDELMPITDELMNKSRHLLTDQGKKKAHLKKAKRTSFGQGQWVNC